MLEQIPRKIPKHFSEMIQEVFNFRNLKNKKYSLRAYARNLGITSGFLSDLLNKKVGLSFDRASEIVKKMNLSIEDEHLFLNLVQEHINKNLEFSSKILNSDSSYLKINDDYFEIIANWYYFAIVELVGLRDFQDNDLWISKRIGVDVEKIRPIIEKLIKVKLLKYDNNHLCQCYDYFVSSGGTPSEAAKKFHKQVMLNAMQAIDYQKIEERNYTSSFLKVRKSDLPKISEKIKNFRRELSQEIESGDGHDSVYAFSIQFYRSDKDIE